MKYRMSVVVSLAIFMISDACADTAINSLALAHTRPDASFGYFTGRLEQDTTWRDTVYVGGDVTIASAATLTLAPNTQVHFLPYHNETQGGLDSTRAELIIEGRLGAQAGGIVFRSADAGSLGAEWHGLVVEQGGRADVSNATIRDGLRCVYAKRGGRVTMDHVAFANCGKPTAPEDAAGLSMSRRSAQPLPALRVAGKTDRQRSKRVDRVAGKSNAETKPAEITIHIRHEHKEVVLALLEAVDGGTPMTGIAELDSLAATYGLIGIYRKGRISPVYGYRFRLTFPPGADVTAIAGDYGNVPYIQAVGSGDSLRVKGVHPPSEDIENAGLRLLAKVGAGTGSGIVVTAIAFGGLGQLLVDDSYSDDGLEGVGLFFISLYVGNLIGFPLGVSTVDPHDSHGKTLLGSGMAGLGGLGLAVVGARMRSETLSLLGVMASFVAPPIVSIVVSEKSREPPQDRRVSFALSSTPNGGLSAVAQLRF